MTDDFLKGKIRLIAGDPSPIILHGLTRICEADSRIQVVSCCTSLQSVRHAAATENPSIMLVDWNLLRWQGNEGMEELQQIGQACPVILLSLSESLTDHKLAMQAGARGLLSKRSSAGQIRKAIWKVVQGGIYLQPSMAESLVEQALSPRNSNDEELQRLRLITPRERQVIGLICKEMRNKQIAAELTISETTVCHHLTSIFTKLQVSDRLGLLSLAYRHSLQLEPVQGNAAPTDRAVPGVLVMKPKARAEAFPAPSHGVSPTNVLNALRQA